MYVAPIGFKFVLSYSGRFEKFAFGTLGLGLNNVKAPCYSRGLQSRREIVCALETFCFQKGNQMECWFGLSSGAGKFQKSIGLFGVDDYLPGVCRFSAQTAALHFLD